MIQKLAINKPIKDTKIVVAMSGGVDSSCVAVILKKMGYQVIGITLQLYDHGQALQKKGACCAGADIYDAQKIAAQFDFPHYVLNYESLFKESVIDDFVDQYTQGFTPIPCVRCNQSVKFRDLLKVAKDLKADGLVTGHYIQKKDNKLFKAIDHTKDQSYFLFATTQEQINYLHFPLGHLTKEQVRKLAQENDIHISNKPDSQDICFVPDGNYAKIIKKHRPSAFKQGDIIDANGQKLGTHDGIINYTIGQRKGLGISAKDPLFVVKIDAKNNQIIVGGSEHLKKSQFSINNINWLGNKKIPDNLTAKLRSSHKPIEIDIKINFDDKTAIVTTINPTRAITPGQACVIYKEEQLLGGGWIDKIIN